MFVSFIGIVHLQDEISRLSTQRRINYDTALCLSAQTGAFTPVCTFPRPAGAEMWILQGKRVAKCVSAEVWLAASKAAASSRCIFPLAAEAHAGARLQELQHRIRGQQHNASRCVLSCCSRSFRGLAPLSFVCPASTHLHSSRHILR